MLVIMWVVYTVLLICGRVCGALTQNGEMIKLGKVGGSQCLCGEVGGSLL